jgi:hypothetical protein
MFKKKGAEMRDHTRDYATAAFDFYRRNGKSVDVYKHRLYKQALEQQQRADGSYGTSKPTEAAVMRVEKIVEEKISEIKDMEAVEKTIKIIELSRNGREILKTIDYVYFEEGKICEKVHIAEIGVPASERSIYRWLGKVRQIFAIERGLRI